MIAKLHKYIIDQIKTADTGQRSHLTALRTDIIEKNKISEAAELILDTVATSVKGMLAANLLTINIINRLHSLIRYTDEVTNKTKAQSGIVILDWFAQIDIIDIHQKNIIMDNKVKPQWFITSLSSTFTEYGKSLSPNKYYPNPNDGPLLWKGPILYTDWGQIHLVKDSVRDNMVHHYTPNKIPEVYNIINRMNSQKFNINEDLLKFASDETHTNSFIPNHVDSIDLKLAMKSMNDIIRKALRKEEIQFKEYHKFDTDIDLKAERDIPKNIRQYIEISQIEYKKILSKSSKRREYEEIIKLANEWKDGNINYVYYQDKRGRFYTKQPYLNPLGSDLAKALLLYKDYDEISGYDLALHVANCYGYDKESFDNRVQWTMDNSEDIRKIGQNPWENWDIIKKLELDREKTLWQGLAASIEWNKLIVHMSITSTEEGFRSRLPIGLDSTSSGTQLLTMITCDDEIAPYVNLTKSPDGKVGNFYQYLADHWHKKLVKSEKAKKYNDLQEFISPSVWPLVGRIGAKRNGMTFNYNSKAYGFGLQHLADKSEYGKIDQFNSHGDKLSYGACFLLGELMYETCIERIKGSAEMMEYLKRSVKTVSKNEIVSWRLPDGFLAYQKCGKPTSVGGAVGTIGDKKITLRIESWGGRGDNYRHTNSIPANFTHSLDSYLLRMIISKMPKEAPISTVHDQFSTSSKYVKDLQEIARECYKIIANRKVIQKMCNKAFKLNEEIPLVGNWDPEELNEAEFFIC